MQFPIFVGDQFEQLSAEPFAKLHHPLVMVRGTRVNIHLIAGLIIWFGLLDQY
jgi:hypothetical protein